MPSRLDKRELLENAEPCTTSSEAVNPSSPECEPPRPVIEKFHRDHTMSGWVEHYEPWIRSCLPEELANQNIDFFSQYYLRGLTVMADGERGGDPIVCFEAENEEDLCYWMLQTVCDLIKEVKPKPERIWRYYRDHAKDNQWYYIERRHYDYNAIEDPRLYGFECFLRNLSFGFPRDRWEKVVQDYVNLMNYWYTTPHWDYDRNRLCFIEISDSKEHDTADGPEEPSPGSIIKVID